MIYFSNANKGGNKKQLQREENVFIIEHTFDIDYRSNNRKLI
jgi:hypothetical protein